MSRAERAEICLFVPLTHDILQGGWVTLFANNAKNRISVQVLQSERCTSYTLQGSKVRDILPHNLLVAPHMIAINQHFRITSHF